MTNIAIMFLIIGLRLFWSGCGQIVAARMVAPERKTFIGGRVFRDYLWSGGFDVFFSLLIVFGALFGRLELDLNIFIIGGLLFLFEKKQQAIDRLAWVVAGVIRDAKKEETK